MDSPGSNSQVRRPIAVRSNEQRRGLLEALPLLPSFPFLSRLTRVRAGSSLFIQRVRDASALAVWLPGATQGYEELVREAKNVARFGELSEAVNGVAERSPNFVRRVRQIALELWRGVVGRSQRVRDRFALWRLRRTLRVAANFVDEMIAMAARRAQEMRSEFSTQRLEGLTELAVVSETPGLMLSAEAAKAELQSTSSPPKKESAAPPPSVQLLDLRTRVAEAVDAWSRIQTRAQGIAEHVEEMGQLEAALEPVVNESPQPTELAVALAKYGTRETHGLAMLKREVDDGDWRGQAAELAAEIDRTLAQRTRRAF